MKNDLKRLLMIFIYSLVAAIGMTAAVPHALAAPIEEETSILIDKSSHILVVYVNETPVYTFMVATGKGNLTPVGEFRIANKIKHPWYNRKSIPGGDKRNPLGTRWLGISIPNTGGYRYGIHGTNRPYSIGQSVSSGCIRMLNRDVEFIFKHIPVGTRVVIQD
ncbi:L,D-transpeptidase [Paenibacillus hexagrammi]|uniref:L,D-transpeptidase n=1 Tax=Paenibacillus hexagrammi TaxID=2908839 RepID=A0ABY3SRU6_9BACL|nr:L,D-transpeptidase [Paenibacillus sp. YPD9-1]UJF35830.1 L,D-transpeptidase [Paenibacillus sp. YPD9-1]